MFSRLKKHSVKILVFVINILLAAIAVFVIREKDQARLLEKAQNENIGSGSAADGQLPSFKNSVSVEEKAGEADIPVDIPTPSDGGAVAPADPVPQNVVPAVPVPAPVPQTKPSNAKTKTS